MKMGLFRNIQRIAIQDMCSNGEPCTSPEKQWGGKLFNRREKGTLVYKSRSKPKACEFAKEK